MAAAVTVTVRRKDELFSKLGRLAPEAQKNLVIANGQTAEEMVSLARSFAPIKTGKLRASIVATPPGGNTPPHSAGGGRQVPPGTYAVTAGNSRVRYAHLVEFGTSAHINKGIMAGTVNPGAPAQPYFFPSYRIVKQRMKSRATRAMNKAIKTVKGGA